MAVSAGSRLAPSNYLSDEKQHRRAIALWEHEAHQGHLGNVGSVTLAVGTASTVVTDFRVEPNAHTALAPTTINAAQALASTYISGCTADAFTITHTKTASAYWAFAYSALG